MSWVLKDMFVILAEKGYKSSGLIEDENGEGSWVL